MKKTVISLVIIFCAVVHCSGIERAETPPAIPESMAKYEKRLMRQFKRLKCYRETENLNVLHVYYLQLNCDEDNKDTFISENLLNNLEYQNGTPKQFPWVYTTIYNDSIEIIAGTNSFMRVMCTYRTLDYDKRMLETLGYGKFDYLFQIRGCTMSLYFALKGNQVYIFDLHNEDNPLLPLETYMDLYWTEDFFRDVTPRN